MLLSTGSVPVYNTQREAAVPGFFDMCSGFSSGLGRRQCPIRSMSTNEKPLQDDFDRHAATHSDRVMQNPLFVPCQLPGPLRQYPFPTTSNGELVVSSAGAHQVPSSLVVSRTSGISRMSGVTTSGEDSARLSMMQLQHLWAAGELRGTLKRHPFTCVLLSAKLLVLIAIAAKKAHTRNAGAKSAS